MIIITNIISNITTLYLDFKKNIDDVKGKLTMNRNMKLLFCIIEKKCT